MNRIGNERTGNALLNVPVAEGVELVEGTMAVITADGYAKPAEAEENVLVAGCVQKYCDNRLGGNGKQSVNIKRGTFVWANDGTIKETDILKPCYIKDMETVTITEDGSSPAGIILEVDSLSVTVDMICNFGLSEESADGEQEENKNDSQSE